MPLYSIHLVSSTSNVAKFLLILMSARMQMTHGGVRPYEFIKGVVGKDLQHLIVVSCAVGWIGGEAAIRSWEVGFPAPR